MGAGDKSIACNVSRFFICYNAFSETTADPVRNIFQKGNYMPHIQFGLTLPSPRQLPRARYLATIQHSLELATGHFDSIWFTDHLQYENALILEGWTALTYWGALYPQFSFGHAVLCQSFRNPALLAKMAATFQYLSGGRFILGIGAGWKEDEYRAASTTR